MYLSLVLVTVLWNQKWRGAISFTAHKMRTAKRGLISNILLVKTNTWKCQGKECEPYLSKMDLIDPGLSSYQHKTQGISHSPTCRSTCRKKPCLGKHENFVSSPEWSSSWRWWPSHLPAHIDKHLHFYKHILVNTFLPIKLCSFGFLLTASNFFSQRIDSCTTMLHTSTLPKLCEMWMICNSHFAGKELHHGNKVQILHLD